MPHSVTLVPRGHSPVLPPFKYRRSVESGHSRARPGGVGRSCQAVLPADTIGRTRQLLPQNLVTSTDAIPCHRRDRTGRKQRRSAPFGPRRPRAACSPERPPTRAHWPASMSRSSGAMCATLIRSTGQCGESSAFVHAAAYVHIGWTGLDLSRAINVAGTAHVAASARRAGARLVHVSSVDAIGLLPHGQPSDEETPVAGGVLCPYVVTKREAEQAVLAEVAQGLDATIVNPAYMIGPWDWKPSSGRMLLEVSRNRGLVAPLGTNNFCDVRDVAQGILTAADRGATGRLHPGRGAFDIFPGLAHLCQSDASISPATAAWPPGSPCGRRMRRFIDSLDRPRVGCQFGGDGDRRAISKFRECPRRARAGLSPTRFGRGSRSRLAVVSRAPLRLKLAIMVFCPR